MVTSTETLSASGGSAEFSINGEHRLRLDRWWAPGPRALVCMTNPSRAGAHDNDATVWNLIALVKALGYPGFTVVNWLPYIATKPTDLFAWRNALLESDGPAYRAIHETAISTIAALTEGAAARFVAWGNMVPQVPHTTAILRALSANGRYELFAFDLTKDGNPKHPAARGEHRMVPGIPPVIWRPARQVAA